MGYSIEKRLLSVLIADHLSNIYERSNIIENNLFLDTDVINSIKRRKKTNINEDTLIDSSGDDLAAVMLGRVTQTEHCLILYYRLLDMPGTIDACVDLLSTSSKNLKSSIDSRIDAAIEQSNDPESALTAAYLIASSLIRDITANGVYEASESCIIGNGLQRTTSINSIDSNLSTYSSGNSTVIFKGIGFVEAIHEAREIAMRDNSYGFDTLKNIIDRVGGKVSRDHTFIYRKILVKLIGLLHTSLTTPVKELIYESIGYLCIYINDIRDIDDAEIDTIDMLLRLSPQFTPKLLSTLPKILDSPILNCSISAINSYTKYLKTGFNKVFNILNDKLNNHDDFNKIDIYIAIYNWLEFAHVHKNEITIDCTINNNLTKLILDYININKFDDCDTDFYVNGIINYIGMLYPESLKELLSNLIKMAKSKLNIHSTLRLFILLWNNSNHVANNAILDLLNDIVDFSADNYDVILKVMCKLESKTLNNLPKSHKVYSKITKLIKLPDNIKDIPPYELLHDIFLLRQILLPLVKSIGKISTLKELKNIKFDNFKWNTSTNNSDHEISLFLLRTEESNKIDISKCMKSFSPNVYCYFALEDLSKTTLILDDIGNSLEASSKIDKMAKSWQAEFRPLEFISTEIDTDIQLNIKRAITAIKNGNVVLNPNIWNDIKDLNHFSTSYLMGNMSLFDTKWNQLSENICSELGEKLSKFLEPIRTKSIRTESTLAKGFNECLQHAYTIILINMGANKYNVNVIDIVSEMFNFGQIFDGNVVFNDLFTLYNKYASNFTNDITLFVQGAWNSYINYVIDSLDDRGISSVGDSVIYIDKYSIYDTPKMLNKLLTSYDHLLQVKAAYQIHGTALINISKKIIVKYCNHGNFFTDELTHNIAKIIYKCILLVREYPNTSSELSNAILKLFKTLKTLNTNESDIATFQLDLEIKFKCSLLREKVGILKNLETELTSPITLEYALIIFTLQNHYINNKRYSNNKFDTQLIQYINPSYQMIRMVARELCNFGGTPDEQRKELSDFIDKYILPMLFVDGGVSRDFCKSLHELIRIRKPKLEKSQPNLKLESVINRTKHTLKNNI